MQRAYGGGGASGKSTKSTKGGGGGGGKKGGSTEAVGPGLVGSAAPAIVICGDFNSQGKSGVRELLVSGEVTAKIRPRYDQDTAEIRSRCDRDTAEIQPRYSRDTTLACSSNFANTNPDDTCHHSDPRSKR